MKRMLHRAISILKEERGETLFESVVSILVFTILIVTVSLMILVSMAITSSANNWSRVMQATSNAAVSGETFVLQQDGVNRNIAVQTPAQNEVIVFNAQFTIVGDDPASPPPPLEVAFNVPVTIHESAEQPELGSHTFKAFVYNPPGP